jgi:hypothetical protein
MSKIPDNHLRALQFISMHPGTRRKAFPCGYRFDFEAPELLPSRRAPFRISTLYRLIDDGYVTKSGPVRLTDRGKALVRVAAEEPLGKT